MQRMHENCGLYKGLQAVVKEVFFLPILQYFLQGPSFFLRDLFLAPQSNRSSPDNYSFLFKKLVR